MNRGIIMADLLDQGFSGGEIIEVRKRIRCRRCGSVAKAPLKRANPTQLTTWLCSHRDQR